MRPPDDYLYLANKYDTRCKNDHKQWLMQKYNKYASQVDWDLQIANQKMIIMNKVFPLNTHFTDSTSSTTYFPLMQGITTASGNGSGIGSITAVIDVPCNTPTVVGGITPTRVFVMRDGTKIVIRENATYEIVSPDNLKLPDYVKAHPHLKLLDLNGNVIEFNENGTLKWHLLRNLSGQVIDIADASTQVRESIMASSFGRIAIPVGGCRLLLPDGVELLMNADGSYQFDDSKQTFTYKAAPRDFNRFLNASDVLEDFIRYLGSMAVRQRHVMSMPVGLFIQWLIIEAAKADGDSFEEVEPPLVEGVKAMKAQPRCHFCKRFISRTRVDRGVNFCSPDHMERFLVREKLDQIPKLRARQRIATPPSDFLLPIPMAAAGG